MHGCLLRRAAERPIEAPVRGKLSRADLAHALWLPPPRCALSIRADHGFTALHGYLSSCWCILLCCRTPPNEQRLQRSRISRACKAPFTVANCALGQPPGALPLQRLRASSRKQEVPASSSSASDLDAGPQGCGGAMRAGRYMACRQGGRGMSCCGRQHRIRRQRNGRARGAMTQWRDQRWLHIRRPTAGRLR